jgi:hypothetical protein
MTLLRRFIKLFKHYPISIHIELLIEKLNLTAQSVANGEDNQLLTIMGQMAQQILQAIMKSQYPSKAAQLLTPRIATASSIILRH